MDYKGHGYFLQIHHYTK